MTSLASETLPSPPTGRRRTLTGPAAVLLALLVCLAGAVLDELTGRGLGAVFGVAFVGACGLAALRVRRSGLRTVAVAPPLMYALVALLAGSLRGTAVPRTANTRLMDLVTDLVFGAPWLIAGTLLALAVVLVRIRRRGSAPLRPGG